ncbi:MAG TPA: PEPxxWA-CTERM sorting domain-containing protein [Caulobacteraceae bacterium]
MKIWHLMIGTAAALSLGAAANATTTVTVDAITPIGSWLDTGLNLNAGTTYDFSVNNPATIWSAGSNIPYSRDSTANGIDPVASGYGTLTMDGFTANFGALVGEVGPTPGGGAGDTFFLIGTGPISMTGLSGELYVGYWDSNYSDNSGTQSLSISVPEPASWALILAGFAGLGAALRSTRRKAYS